MCDTKRLPKRRGLCEDEPESVGLGRKGNMQNNIAVACCSKSQGDLAGPCLCKLVCLAAFSDYRFLALHAGPVSSGSAPRCR